MSLVEGRTFRDRALRVALLVAACTAMTAAGQSKSPPTWGPAQPQQPSSFGQPSPGSSLSAPAQQPSGMQAHQAQAPGSARQLAGGRNPTPPVPRDCRKAVTHAEPNYMVRFTHAETNGYTSGPNIDLGYVINTTHGAADAVLGSLDDLQIRIEQLRCENENLAAKLDYLGAKLDYVLWKLPQ